MNRRDFFEIIAGEYFTVEEGMKIPDREFVDFEIGKTFLASVIKDKKSRVEMREFLLREKVQDDWFFLSEEFAGMAIEMMSNTTIIGDVGTDEIQHLEKMYHSLVREIYELSFYDIYKEEVLKKKYIEHMDKLRSFLMSVMDIEELKNI